MRALPGVRDAALTTHLPLSIPNAAGAMLTVKVAPGVRLESAISFASVSPGYFETMNVRLLKGRAFRDGDTADAPKVVILNNHLAQIVFGKRDPLGQYVSFGPPPESWLEVVGVVADTVGSSVEHAPMPEAFTPYLEEPSFAMTFVLRTSDHPETLAGSVRAAVLSIDKNQPLSEISTLDDLIAKSIAPRRFRTLLVGLFALLALLLSTVGIYGVISYSVEQRTHELGVRAALGATRADIVRLVVAQGFRITLLGILAGVAGALALTRLMAGMLYRTDATDPWTFSAVAALLFSSALAACAIPAQRASKVDPMVALRNE